MKIKLTALLAIITVCFNFNLYSNQLNYGSEHESCEDYKYQAKKLVNQINKQIEIGRINKLLDDKIASYKEVAAEAKKNGCKDEIFEKNVSDWGGEAEDSKIKADPYKYLLDAIIEGDKDKVDKAVLAGADVNGGAPRGKYAFTSTITALSHNQPEILKHLIDKGATVSDEAFEKINLEKNIDANIEVLRYVLKNNPKPTKFPFTRYVCNAIMAKRLDLIKELDNNKNLPRTNDSYIGCYTESQRIENKEIRNYFTNKILAIDWQTKFSDYKVGMTNSNITSQMRSAISARTGKRQYTHIKISSSDYTVYKNQITGVITHREIYAICFLKLPDGVCVVDKLKFKQDYDGTKYTKMYVTSTVGGTDFVEGL